MVSKMAHDTLEFTLYFAAPFVGARCIAGEFGRLFEPGMETEVYKKKYEFPGLLACGAVLYSISMRSKWHAKIGVLIPTILMAATLGLPRGELRNSNGINRALPFVGGLAVTGIGTKKINHTAGVLSGIAFAYFISRHVNKKQSD